MSSYLLRGNNSPPIHRYGGNSSSSGLRYGSNETLDSNMHPGAPRTEWPDLASSSQTTTNDAIAT
uniref:Uncharacterized protein n=1 Tax=Acrobeloides nanus TaxID=290746 RepID=A0A914DDU0_9BILA